MEKASILGAAALAIHAAQNVAADELLLKHKAISAKFGHHLANAFHAGVEGSSQTMSKAKAFASGAILPEVHALTQKANELGSQVGHSLSPRQIVALRHISNGNLDKGRRLLQKEHGPAVHAMLGAMHINANHLLNASKEGLAEAGEHIKKSPFLNPVRSALSRDSIHALKNKVVEHSPHGATAALLGSAASAVVEPAAATVNAMKTAYTHPGLDHVPGISHAKNLLNHYYKKVFKHAYTRGTEGKKTAFRTLQRYGLNAVAQRGEDLTNDVTRALSKPSNQ